MKDKWMNMGYEDDDLKPYIEPEAEYNDLRRIGTFNHLIINLFMEACNCDFYVSVLLSLFRNTDGDGLQTIRH